MVGCDVFPRVSNTSLVRNIFEMKTTCKPRCSRTTGEGKGLYVIRFILVDGVILSCSLFRYQSIGFYLSVSTRAHLVKMSKKLVKGLDEIVSLAG